VPVVIVLYNPCYSVCSHCTVQSMLFRLQSLHCTIHAIPSVVIALYNPCYSVCSHCAVQSLLFCL